MESSSQKMTMRDAGYLGYLASRDKCQEAKNLRHEEYAKNPKCCIHCGKALPWEKKHNKFCNSSCAGSHNNLIKKSVEVVCKKCGKTFLSRSGNRKLCDTCQHEKEKNGTLERTRVRQYKYTNVCKVCGKVTQDWFEKTYCSQQCLHLHQWHEKVKLIEERGEFSSVKQGVTKDETNRKEVKRYLTEKHGHKCSICGLTEWMGQPIPLVVDHIDGNPTNHAITNFRLVCGNCDMQLPTYKAKNKGKGRKYRRTDNQ